MAGSGRLLAWNQQIEATFSVGTVNFLPIYYDKGRHFIQQIRKRL